MDLCAEPLLSILQFVVSFRFCVDSDELVTSAHLLLAVFNEIIVLSKSRLINDFVVALLMERDEIFRYFKTYCGHVCFYFYFYLFILSSLIFSYLPLLVVVE